MAKNTKRWKTAVMLLSCVILLLTNGCGTPEHKENMEGLLIAKSAEQEDNVCTSPEDRSIEQENSAHPSQLEESAEPQATVEQSQAIEAAQETALDGKGISKEIQCSLEAPYARAYCQFLLECLAQRSDTDMEYRFRLVLIDGDAVPELLLFRNDCHAAGVNVCTYAQGEVVELGEFGSFGKMQYVEGDGMIFDHFMGQGEALTYFHQLTDGEINVICRMHSWPEYLWKEQELIYAEYYEIDDKSTTEEIYEAKWEELYDSQSYVLIGYEDGIALSEDNLLPALTQQIDSLLWKRDSQPILDLVARQEEALDAYGLLLRELANERKTVPFTLLYLDGDDIPELAVINVYEAEIYTCERGKAVLVGNYGISPEGTTVYREKEGIIFSDYRSSGTVLRIHQVNAAEDTVLQEFMSGWRYADGREDDVPISLYEIDDKEVSEAQYDEALQEWKDNAANKILRENTCTLLQKDMDTKETLREQLQTLILTQYDTLKRNALLKSGMGEDSLLHMDYDDFDGDGRYEAFLFFGEKGDGDFGSVEYSGDYWFAGADCCVCLSDSSIKESYRMIDGQMIFETADHRQKYLYCHSAIVLTANLSRVWTVENGEPVQVHLPQIGEVLYRPESRWDFEVWANGYDHYYEPADDLWTGHTWRPYFYHYERKPGETGAGELKPDVGEHISREELQELCGFDLVGKVEAEGYEVTEIVRWKPSDIVTVNYTIPPDEYGAITYENIVWDCVEQDYWRKEERGVTCWQNAGYGGSI
ncbi:MAG: hypothetical protein NC543_09200 [bacterium]|nr:hypothetical protein [bacterium]MCM1375726.1 hypothetical protein [Muribaculum sp.]